MRISRTIRAFVLGLLGATHLLACGDGEPTEPLRPYSNVVDLGRLGGTHSRAQDINDHGQVVGYAETATGCPHAFLWGEGAMTDLGTLGGCSSNAYAINNHGQVVGNSETSNGAHHAVLWQDAAILDLGTLPGHDNSFAHDINDREQIVGYSYRRSYPDEEPAHAFLWESGVMIDLGPEIKLFAINDSGTAVGCRKEGFMCSPAILWQDGQTTDLGTSSYAKDINNASLVIVYRYTGEAFLWEEGVLTQLRPPGASSALASSINDAGQVVGYGTVGGATSAFLWEDGKWTNLGLLAQEAFGADSAAETLALAINNSGQVVGARVTGDSRRFEAILWNAR